MPRVKRSDLLAPMVTQCRMSTHPLTLTAGVPPSLRSPSTPALAYMGRKPWATPEQTVFLEAQLPNMDAEKANNGLTMFYARITREFITQWASPIVPIPLKRQHEGLELKAYTDERRGAVSPCIRVLGEPTLTIYPLANYRMVQETPQEL